MRVSATNRDGAGVEPTGSQAENAVAKARSARWRSGYPGSPAARMTRMVRAVSEKGQGSAPRASIRPRLPVP